MKLCFRISVVLLCCASRAPAADTWHAADEIRRELQNPIGITWSARPMRDALSSLSASQHIAMWLDRRVDPGLPLEFSFENTPVQDVLEQVAKRFSLGLGFVGPVVYLGPTAVSEKLWTLTELRSEESRQLPLVLRTKWSQRKATQWPEFSTPRELLQAIADEAGCKIEGLDAIPHDLWLARILPPMTFTERLTLILAGFDRTFQFVDNGRTIRLIDVPARATLHREYAPRGDLARNVADLSQRFPNSAIQRAGAKLTVTGSAEDHDAILRSLRGETDRRPTTPKGPVEERWSITVENQPLGVVLRTLNVKAQLQVSVDENAQEKLHEKVSFAVKEATLEQLLRAAMQNTGLTFQLQGKQLRVSLAN